MDPVHFGSVIDRSVGLTARRLYQTRKFPVLGGLLCRWRKFGVPSVAMGGVELCSPQRATSGATAALASLSRHDTCGLQKQPGISAFHPALSKKHRTYGTGPAYRKIGGRLVYAVADLSAWADIGTRTPSSDPGAGTGPAGKAARSHPLCGKGAALILEETRSHPRMIPDQRSHRERPHDS